MSIQTLDLDQLRRADVNARRTNPDVKRKPEIEGLRRLAESIRHEGLLTPMIVAGPNAAGQYDVLDGGRRLEALHLLAAEDPVFGQNIPVAIYEGDMEADARSAALAANIMREPLHPVDAYEAFAGLAAEGLSETAIAARYAITAKEVKQRLALGKLSPAIRGAWRAGDIDADEAEAFTLASTHEQQDAVLKKLKKGGGLYNHNIRRHIIGDERIVARLLKFVGRDAYMAAGGSVIEDLFAATDRDAAAAVSNFPLLQKLADDKRAGEIERLKKQGWGWVEPREDHPHAWSYKKASATKSKEDKARAGCIVDIDYDGKLAIKRGLMKPGTKAARKPKGQKPSDPTAPAPIPFSLKRSLTEQRTVALQNVVANRPDLALPLLVAALSSVGGPARITLSGYCRSEADVDWCDRLDAASECFDFVEAFEATRRLSIPELLKRLALFVATSINTVESNPLHGDLSDACALIDACPEGDINAALDRAFDADAYFLKAGKAHSLKAIEDCDANADPAALNRKKAKELAAMAACKAREQGWLPPELRHDRYAGPAARQPPVPLPDPAPAKPRRRKGSSPQ